MTQVMRLQNYPRFTAFYFKITFWESRGLQLQVPKPLGHPSKYHQGLDDDFACVPLLILTIKVTKMKLLRHVKYKHNHGRFRLICIIFKFQSSIIILVR